ncbi:murein transglycosylase A [Oricola cellulosilytica]|uniref:peptidoglycan lytic exotransglycosylase n=1 Tax=Oricola cellulosilytica TaxID=1429082 RepID=A0A4R0PGM6_9HYPH|nr:MltA domain-containing protein [Oricola cellulosilytica]TCD15994.1 transglycosylase [Oricola cellulosilytica]
MWSLRTVEFPRLPGWAEDDHSAALEALSRHFAYKHNRTYRKGAIGVDAADLEPLHAAAAESAAQKNPRSFFEAAFDAVSLQPGADERGLVTAYYEPVIAASRERTGRFSTPFYRRPADLVEIGEANRPPGWEDGLRFGCRSPDGTVDRYPDRATITNGWLEGRDLEIAYVEDPVDVFFAHVQGAARLEFADGATTRIGYDGKNGHPFTAIGRLLAERGEIEPAEVGMASIRNWLARDRERGQHLMNENRSYIFFRETADEPSAGPVAAAKVPLMAGRSIAVDRLLHTFGTPVFVRADAVNGETWARLMIAQDTGSAIVGPARGDLFMGSGSAAGALAGNVRSPADFHLLVPKGAVLPNPAGAA